MKSLISYLKKTIVNTARRMSVVLDPVFVSFCPSRHSDRVVIVRLDAIGDFFLWLPYASVYRKLYPNRKLLLVANSAWADFAKLLPYWDSVYPIDTVRMARDPLYRWKTLRQLRSTACSSVVHPTFSREILCGDSVVRFLRASEKLGSAGDHSNISALDKILSDCWYTKLVTASSSLMMELDRNAEFVINLYGLEFASAEKKIPFSSVELKRDLVIDEKYFIIFPGASWTGKIWPLSRYLELASWVYSEYSLRLVVCGSSKEIEMGRALLAQTDCPNAINLVGKTSLAEFYQVVQRACFLIGNDTSAVHISAAAGVPSICIIGGGHYGRFMPYPEGWSVYNPIPVSHVMSCFGCGWNCSKKYDRYGPVPCVDFVELEELKVAITRLIRRAGILSNFTVKSLL